VDTALLSGRYRLGNEIGRGGMSTVYEATDELLRRNVAVKLLDLHQATMLEANERFRREAQIAASLNHPNIVTIYDTGLDGTKAFIVMELLAGPTLVERVSREGRLPMAQVLSVGEQVCRALSAAHAAGVVHRDIKPSNVAYARDNTVKVLDFGVARMIEATTGQAELTRTATVIGTASYLAPEQARGDLVSASTDLYALGCLLFALVAGRPPFRGENALAVCSQHLYKEPPDLSLVVDGAPRALCALVGELLQKDPARRPSDAESVRRRLRGVSAESENDLTLPLPISERAARLPITEELVATRQFPTDVTVTRFLASPPGDSDGEPRRGRESAIPRPRHRRRWAVVASLVVVLGITVGTLASSNTPPKSPSLPAITIPPPAAGASPLPAPLVKALNNLARSTAS
jgi:serine/threonine-protein kinase